MIDICFGAVVLFVVVVSSVVFLVDLLICYVVVSTVVIAIDLSVVAS